MQILNVTLAFYILIHVVRCASVQQAASQLPNDTINRKFHHAIQGSHLRDGATTCGVATRSDWPLRTPPTQSGVSAAVRGYNRIVGGFQETGATLAHSAQAQRVIDGTHTHDTTQTVPPTTGQGKMHCTAQHPVVDHAENSTCTNSQPMHGTQARDHYVTSKHRKQSLTPPHHASPTHDSLEHEYAQGDATTGANKRTTRTPKPSTTCMVDDVQGAGVKLECPVELPPFCCTPLRDAIEQRMRTQQHHHLVQKDSHRSSYHQYHHPTSTTRIATTDLATAQRIIIILHTTSNKLYRQTPGTTHV